MAKRGLRVACILAFMLLLLFGGAVFYGSRTIQHLLGENKKLREAISSLTHEDQIGYAKVMRQEKKDGQLFTHLKFIETARDNQLRTILEKEYTIAGDVIHFDALIVTFSNRSVMDGKERSLYIWRRVYGEKMSPSHGFPIESEGQEPERYRDLLDKLNVSDRGMFWETIWQLANDPDALRKHDIKAVYGNAVYKKLRPGLIYVFKISKTGQLYPETVPDM
jgi:hypothetical protein